MIKKYTVFFKDKVPDEIICDITEDNGQGVTIQDNGALIFTLANHDCVVYAPGFWLKMESE